MPRRQPNTATDTRQSGRVGEREAPSLESFNELMRVDPLSLDPGERVRHLQDVEAHAAWFELVRLEALAAVAGPDPDSDEAETATEPDAAERERFPVCELVRDEVAAALRLSPMAAQRRIDIARGVVHRLPETRQLLKAGVCTAAQAAVIVDETARLDVSVARRVEKLSLSRVGSQTPTQTRRAVRRAALRLAPVAPVEVLEEEFAKRDVQLWHDGDGHPGCHVAGP